MSLLTVMLPLVIQYILAMLVHPGPVSMVGMRNANWKLPQVRDIQCNCPLSM